MKKIFIYIFALTFFFADSTKAAVDNSISCSGLPSSAGCDQCFKGENAYPSYMNSLYDVISNPNPNTDFILYADNYLTTTFLNLQPSGLNWNIVNTPDWQTPAGFTWSTGGSSGRNLYIVRPLTNNFKYIEAKPGKGLTLLSTSNFSSINKNLPGSMYKFELNYKTRSPAVTGGSVSTDYFKHTECVYYYPSWCGDGTLDSQETCDPNDTSHTGWGPGGCSQTTCTPITTPSCINGGTGGPQITPVTQTTTGLCTTGPVGNFVATPSGTTINYTWSCNGIGGGNCSASYTPSTTTCTNGGVGGIQTLPINNTTAGLCQAGTTVGNFVATQNGSTTNYTWSCSGNSGPNCTASYTNGGGGAGEPTCNQLTATPTSTLSSTLDSTMVCEGNNRVDFFRIDCGNGQIKDNLNAVPFQDAMGNNLKRGTATCNYSGGPAYNPRCYAISNSIPGTSYTSSSCQKSVSLNPGGGGGGGGGSCTRILVNDNSPGSRTETSTGTFSKTITCEGSGVGYVVNCGNGTNQSTTQISAGRWQTTCVYTALSNVQFSPSCIVSGESTPRPPCVTRLAMGGSSYCGDGVLQRPNSNLQMEECERGSSGWPIFCNTDCSIKTFTYPKSAGLELGPIADVIIGDDVNPYEYIGGGVGFGVKPYLYNNSSEEVFFDKMCVRKKVGKLSTILSISGLNEICIALGHVYPGDRREMSVPNYLGNKDVIPSGESFLDNIIETTIKHGTHYYYDPAQFEVRVAKPTLATAGGGISIVTNNPKIGDVNKVVTGKNTARVDPNTNKNFVGASVSNNSISSYSKTVSTTTKAQVESTKYKNSVANVVNTTSTTTKSSSSNFADFTNYNGLSNVFIIKNTNFTISGPVPGTGPRTYIIENGNLIIGSDIAYADNIAFVVRGGNLIIKHTVKSINGTYITIGGVIKGDGTKTNENQLQVNGSLYGDVNALINERTYIDENINKQLDVGTIVSFGSSIFRKTAPLTGQFIGEYLQSKKIAH